MSPFPIGITIISMDEITTAKRILVIVYLVALHLVVFYFLYEKFATERTSEPEVALPGIEAANVIKKVTPTASSTLYNLVPTNAATVPPPVANPGALIIPVAGVGPEKLVDSFRDARSEGRVHDAIDIMAPQGTPVLAAADGEIARFFDSQAGGTTIYQMSADRKLVYYYAHLQARADDVKVGDLVKQGRTIGYVGDTGNAGPGNYHLHFSIAIVTDPKRYWEGTYIDPYPYLKNGTAPQIP